MLRMEYKYQWSTPSEGISLRLTNCCKLKGVMSKRNELATGRVGCFIRKLEMNITANIESVASRFWSSHAGVIREAT